MTVPEKSKKYIRCILKIWNSARRRISTRLDGWKTFANEVTSIVQGIIEFVKLIDTFTHLSQEEQISSLKTSVFELIVITVSQYYDAETTPLLVNRDMLPNAVFSSEDPAEMQFILAMHACIREFAQLQLTNIETALLCTWVLLDRTSTQPFIVHQYRNCLQRQFAARLTDSRAPMERVCELMSRLQILAQDHIRLLHQLYAIFPIANEKGTLPDLYKELFTPPSS